MKSTVLAARAAFVVGVVTLQSAEAHAHEVGIGPIDVEIGAEVGYATKPNGDVPYNQLGFRLGGRAGFDFFRRIYLGMSAIYYFGGGQEAPPPAAISSNAFLVGVEIGYSVHVGILTIRPQLGVGAAALTRAMSLALPCAPPAGCYGGVSVTESHVYLEPGVTALLSFGLLYVGADVNLLVIPDVNQGQREPRTYASFVPDAQVGVHF